MAVIDETVVKPGTSPEKRVRLTVSGRVQGVGFRPTVYQYAIKLGLRGFVENNNLGVTIEIEGNPGKIEEFIKLLTSAPPPLAKIENMRQEDMDGLVYKDFQIQASRNIGESKTEIPVDVALCSDCRREMEDPEDRRYGYAFTNCTNCGPRFSIIEDLPYDREMTTMKSFVMCAKCKAEYEDPKNRRFHAEPVSCPDCGPQLIMMSPTGRMKTKEPLASATRLLQHGIIMGVKGLGGYHLVCDATNHLAVQSLRRRKKRPDKPFAIMFPNLETAKEFCYISPEEEKLLLSPESPIVLLQKKKGGVLSQDIAPGNNLLGVMLPYTPLHHLLISHFKALVMTSANFTDEPIISDEEELSCLMETVIDCALTHDRAIAHKCDDSIVRMIDEKPTILRRARGYVPNPILLSKSGPSIFAAGPEMKSTFGLSKGTKAYLSQHLGDLQEFRTSENYEREFDQMQKLLEIQPEVAAYDLHPDYWSTRFAMKTGLKTQIGVQHHHAHIASCMVEHGLNEPVLGICFDGTGYGTDENLWGSEFLVADFKEFTRMGHLRYQALPGGEQSVYEPWRIAISYLYSCHGNDMPRVIQPFAHMVTIHQMEMVLQMIDKKINSPLSSGMGRLFDAVYGILGIANRITFEGQTGMYLENLVDPKITEAYRYEINEENGIHQINVLPMFREIQLDMGLHTFKSTIATKFHNTIVSFSTDMAKIMREKNHLNKVMLSGGCFQNAILTQRLVDKLKSGRFEVYTHHTVPPNDGGISLGQLAIAQAKVQ